MKLFFAVIGFALLLSACAHHHDVRPGADGIHRVVLQTDDSDQGARDAIDQANHFCKEQNKYAAFVEEKKTYTGDMEEKNYKNAKRASNVAKTVGGAAWVFGGKKESNIGGIVGLGGAAADTAIGQGYTVDMRFKCQ